MSSGVCVNAIIMSSCVSSKLGSDWLEANDLADNGGIFVSFWQIISYQDNVMKPFICVAFA